MAWLKLNTSKTTGGAMSKLDELMPLIENHKDKLNQPGVIFIRPGYKMENNWPTKEPAIIAVVSRNAADVHLPASLDSIPVEKRLASDIEEFRFHNTDKYNELVLHHGEFRAGAFPEADPEVAEKSAPLALDAGFNEELLLGVSKKPQLPYTPADVPLTPVKGKIPIICHASPDAGWPTLRDFLAGVQQTLTVGLYDFTSKHILDSVTQSLNRDQAFKLVLDHPAKNPSADQTDPETVEALSDTLGDNFKQVWALVRNNKEIKQYIYPSAYHIKTAVRDSNSTWLSSGNWNNSNQPDMDPISSPSPDDQALARKSDRDWHVIIDSSAISGKFEAYIKHDFEVASSKEEDQPRGLVSGISEAAMPEEFRSIARGTFQFHKPLKISGEELTITPLLTPDPDSYRPAMLNLINSAKSKLYIQLQYIHPPKEGVDNDFKALIDAVVEKINDGLDVRIICSEYQAMQGWLERLQDVGIDLGIVKLQNGVHNKGFVVDGKVVALGSQNWSGDGVLRNRDASVIIESETAATYFETIFLHDWDRIATQKMD
jgi:phosphatidylserine/phosphatidylglycerophosphate/cardiolipin synthase-like enzyme